MVNSVTLIGRMGNDPETKLFAQSDTMVCKFSLATTKKWRDKQGEKQEKTQWHQIECWGPLAKIVADYFKKGYLLHVEGSIEYSKSESNGETKYFTKIRADRINNLTPKQTD